MAPLLPPDYCQLVSLTHAGLVALSCDEVMELMAQDYSRKYQEYMDVVQEREFQAAFKRKVMETRRVASMVGRQVVLVL